MTEVSLHLRTSTPTARVQGMQVGATTSSNAGLRAHPSWPPVDTRHLKRENAARLNGGTHPDLQGQSWPRTPESQVCPKVGPQKSKVAKLEPGSCFGLASLKKQTLNTCDVS